MLEREVYLSNPKWVMALCGVAGAGGISASFACSLTSSRSWSIVCVEWILSVSGRESLQTSHLGGSWTDNLGGLG